MMSLALSSTVHITVKGAGGGSAHIIRDQEAESESGTRGYNNHQRMLSGDLLQILRLYLWQKPIIVPLDKEEAHKTWDWETLQILSHNTSHSRDKGSASLMKAETSWIITSHWSLTSQTFIGDVSLAIPPEIELIISSPLTWACFCHFTK